VCAALLPQGAHGRSTQRKVFPQLTLAAGESGCLMQRLVESVPFGRRSMTSPDSPTSASVGTLSVLVVEPAFDDLLPLTSMLSGVGFRVTAAETFAQARALLNSDPPAILITAVRLGLYNGLHLVLRSKASLPDLAALVTSPAEDPVLRADAEAMGATFIVKPISTDDLLAALLRTMYARDRSAGPIRAPFERRASERRISRRPVHPERRRAERRRDLSLLVRGGSGRS
jgi:DNA-binding NtrC family response regulator